jgi:hypothetical protein
MTTTPAAAKSANGPGRTLEGKIAQAVRNSLNLPRLRVNARRGRASGNWMVSLQQGRFHSEWLELNPASVAIVKKVGLLPPILLGTFRLAYDALSKDGKSATETRRH